MAGAVHEVKPRRGQIVILEARDAMPTVRVSGASQLLAKHGGASSAPSALVSLGYTNRAKRYYHARQHKRVRRF